MAVSGHHPLWRRVLETPGSYKKCEWGLVCNCRRGHCQRAALQLKGAGGGGGGRATRPDPSVTAPVPFSDREPDWGAWGYEAGAFTPPEEVGGW